MILDFLSQLPENAAQEFKDSHPEKNEHMVKTMIALTDMATNMLRESPEFRQAFARAHEEFLKFPESKTTIERAMHAQQEFGPKMVH